MIVLLVGGGGREHAIASKLLENPSVDTLYALPGNGGFGERTVCVPVAATNIPGIVAFARDHEVDYAVVAPDDPLALGCVDALNAIGVPCFGPVAAAAKIESSKAFSKDLMKCYGIPTASYECFDDIDNAMRYVDVCPLPTVLKADGLALGKGVLICHTREAAREGVQAMMGDKVFGASGSTIVVEEFLEGPEVTVLSFTDGTTIKPMVSSMDHKRAHDGDTGLNTGGMGCIAPNPFYTDDIADECMRRIFLPTIRAMKAEGREFRGCLYFGLMLTKNGPKVIEYNCRFGDPETQAVLPLLESDLLTIMQAVTEGRLAEAEVRFSGGACCGVVLASKGYPEHYEKGCPVQLPETKPDEWIFSAGLQKTEEGKLISAGGRVLCATAKADTLEEAIQAAYALADKVDFPNGFRRGDIGARALEATSKN